ncbi:hypothetical protein IPZ70_07225 [Streptomyces polychromogenes]|nr:hypothetical protein [Streptomyces polychromogenes]
MLLLLGGALRNAGIGLRLGIGGRTAKKHVASVLARLAIRSRPEAALVAVLHHPQLCPSASDPQGPEAATPALPPPRGAGRDHAPGVRSPFRMPATSDHSDRSHAPAVRTRPVATGDLQMTVGGDLLRLILTHSGGNRCKSHPCPALQPHCTAGPSQPSLRGSWPAYCPSAVPPTWPGRPRRAPPRPPSRQPPPPQPGVHSRARWRHGRLPARSQRLELPTHNRPPEPGRPGTWHFRKPDLKFLGGAGKVGELVGLAPSNHGSPDLPARCRADPRALGGLPGPGVRLRLRPAEGLQAGHRPRGRRSRGPAWRRRRGTRRRAVTARSSSG